MWAQTTGVHQRKIMPMHKIRIIAEFQQFFLLNITRKKRAINSHDQKTKLKTFCIAKGSSVCLC